jgi:mannose-6-phosphate isomerase
MWYVLSAEPGATIGLGFRRQLTTEELRAAIEDGSVVDLVNWMPVAAGDTLYAPAGVVHAIGGGVALCEIQQNSDITYRLYDYGRPRELHLVRGLEVALTAPYDGKRSFPVESPHFTTELLDVPEPLTCGLKCEYLLVPIAGRGRIQGEPFETGQVWFIPSGCGDLTLAPESEARFLRARARSPQSQVIEEAR